jgi:hypothetical protein
VQRRFDHTVSERHLVLALAKTSRAVPLSRLAAWRKDGLLPPLASTGTGTGRAYYWREPDILRHAEIVYDGLARHGRAELVTIALWLRGFAVALPKFKRAWQSCLKTRKPPGIRRPPVGQGVIPSFGGNLSGLLLEVTLGTATALQIEGKSRPALLMLTAAANRLDIPVGDSASQVRQIWQMVQLVASTLATSDVISEASETEMLKARDLLRIGLTFVADSVDQEPDTAVDVLGETLFLYILALLRTRQNAVLDLAIARIQAAMPQAFIQPEPLYALA